MIKTSLCLALRIWGRPYCPFIAVAYSSGDPCSPLCLGHHTFREKWAARWPQRLPRVGAMADPQPGRTVHSILSNAAQRIGVQTRAPDRPSCCKWNYPGNTVWLLAPQRRNDRNDLFLSWMVSLWVGKKRIKREQREESGICNETTVRNRRCGRRGVASVLNFNWLARRASGAGSLRGRCARSREQCNSCMT